ncbi:MAG: UDP-N-acetylmuramoyl-L-alanyl-D-glutamate--2,6-diaminopimelate ligase [Planctomycetota bacterium]|nr:UDP-N-acetylmuramoyl-L-alanyl-D-glutamate--2,6-diaminopimelate ligase [Planctomycetota bacterium]
MSHRLPQFQVPISLRRLFPQASFVGCADARVVAATEDSRACTEGCLFAAIPGTRYDGSQFIAKAIANGATTLLVQTPIFNVSVPQCIVPNVRLAFAELCAAMAWYPSRQLELAAVTGTNGKTTTTWLIRSIFQAAGLQAGLLGTIEYSDGCSTHASGLTTPDSQTLQRWLTAMPAQGTSHAAIEFSSHALDQDRAAGTLVDVGVITNITQDHFDYHGDFNTYCKVKGRIAEYCKPNGTLLLNADDEGCRQLLEADLPVATQTFAIDRPADTNAVILNESVEGTQFEISFPNDHVEVFTTLIGRHNVSNCLAAAAAAFHLGISVNRIREGLLLDRVPGRLERIQCGQPFQVFVDYAHTDDALCRIVRCLRRLTSGRVICVFGAGGDRDQTKRPLMGRSASEADVAVVTSDNPRTESPQVIIEEILAGFPAEQTPHVEVDRKAAIVWSLNIARPGDSVVIAGKGHETTQQIGSRKIPFDDRLVVREHLSRWTGLAHQARMPA